MFKKFLSRLLEKFDRKLHPIRVHIPQGSREEITDLDCGRLENLISSHEWDSLTKVMRNRKRDNNERGNAYCDGRTFVLIKKSEELDELAREIGQIVENYQKRTEEERLSQAREESRPTIASYVP